MQVEFIKSLKPVEYSKSLEYMQLEVERLISGEANVGKIWFLEHPSVYTAGTGAREEDLLQRDKFPVLNTGRGGKFTYHGPGQRVVYFMLPLKQLHEGEPDIKKFVRQVEQWLVESFKELSISVYPNEKEIGIWTKNKFGTEAKIAAMGIRVKKWIIFHGVAININPNLSHYSGIVPCGIRDKAVTSLWNEEVNIEVDELDEILLNNFIKTFNCDIVQKGNLEL